MLEWRTTASSNIHQKSVGVLQNLTYEGIMSIKTGVFYAFGFLFSQVFVLRVFFLFVCFFKILFPGILTFLLLSLEKENFIVSGVGMG